jgi:hypothetical protein
MGIPTLISTSTASGSSSIDITSGIDSTYDEYMFVFTDVNPATDATHLSFQVNAVAGSGFNETITSTFFNAYHNEADTSTAAEYNTSYDLAQATGFQNISLAVGADSDQSTSGILHLFSPSSTTYVKHFIARFNSYEGTDYSTNYFTAGYINTTTAIDEISFKMSSGNFDGVIQMYGIS